ncbi:MAG: acylase [Bryobacterales bacterium]|nr:acylase [Bryobacterales bacterium]
MIALLRYRFVQFLALTICLASSPLQAAQAAPKGTPSKGTEILWDRFGVPHVYAKNTEDLFYGFGWAQAHSHGNLLLRLYGESRARGAEYFGPEALALDRWLAVNEAPATALRWYNRQTPAFRRYLDAFAKGINDYAAKHPELLSADVKQVLPVSGLDPLQHALRLFQYSYVSSAARVTTAVRAAPSRTEDGGSNAWALAPARTANGNAMLLGNPHLPWSGWYTYYEANLQAPGVNLYGATQVGLPVLRFVFSDYLGFNQTVNSIDGMDLYALTVKDGKYLFDGEWKAFDTAGHTLKIRDTDGSLRTETVDIRKSVHGPVVHNGEGKTLAMRVAGLDRPFALEQYWQMQTARSFREYETALRRLQVPTFNIVYADRDGNIHYLFNGLLPKRKSGDLRTWAGVLPGDTSSTLWTDYHDFDELPQVFNPPSGYVQNTNDPPWNAAWPDSLDPDKYPSYTAPRNASFRAHRSLRILGEMHGTTLEEFITRKHSTRAELADRILDDLLAAVDANGATARLKAAAKVLASWDRQTNADSRGALLFLYWAQKFMGPAMADPSGFAVPYAMAEPLTTPRGLKNPAEAVAFLDEAAAQMEKEFGGLDTAWGEVMKYRHRNVELPANGGFGNLGIFRVITFGPMQDRKRAPIHGETFVICVEFAKTPRAYAIMSYGNSSQPQSPHAEDQLEWMTRKALRPVWRNRPDVMKNLEQRHRF